MTLRRRQFLRQSLAAGAAASAIGAETEVPVTPDYEKPVFQLHKACSTPVKIASIELLRLGGDYFVRSRSSDGATGMVRTKEVSDFIPILLRRVIPHFVGNDARDLETLIDRVYIKNYKLAGQSLWSPVAFVEQSLFDLLGRVAGKPAGALMGGVIRKEVPVYLSGSIRETTAEEEVAVYVQGVKETGAKAVKFKIGGRMSRNRDQYPGRTRTMMELARKTLGDGVTIYVDANGSYNAAKAIEVGKWLEGLGVGFYEEPCPWEEVSETQQVADALDLPVAGGECDSSLWKFQWMIRTRCVNIVQPDLNYNGGFIRAARVARMAREAGIPITPHNTQTGAASVNILAFASAIPNIGPYMEYPWRRTQKAESWYAPNFFIRDGKLLVPQGPGLGIEFDPAYMQKAQVVRDNEC